MGCDMSTEHQIINPKITPAQRNLSEKKKLKILPFVQRDDLLSMASIMEEQQIKPNSEISDAGMQWMLIHMCCRWDSPHCLEYLLKEYFSENPRMYIDFVNAPTVEGYTCLHLCGIWKADRCFSLLLNYGGLNLKALDKMRKTPLQTALDFKSNKVAETLKQFEQLGLDFLQINTQKLSQGSLLTDLPSSEENSSKKNENFEFKLDKNLYGVTGNLFDFTEEEKKMREEQAKLQIEKEKIMLEKMKKKEEAMRRKQEAKILQKKKREEALLKKKEEEEKKKKEAESMAENLMGNLAEYVDEMEGEADSELDWQDDDSWGDGWNMEDDDEEDKKMTENMKKKEEEIKKVQREMKELENKKMDLYKQNEIKNIAIYQQKHTQIRKRIDEKNAFLRENSELIASKRQTVSRVVPAKIAEEKKRLAPSSDGIPPEVLNLYESAKSQGKFVDKEFPAVNATIGDASKSNFKSLTSQLAWLRPSEFFKGEYQLFDGIDPNDIKQGSLGVCYMLATISALAANPKSIEKIFVFHDIQVGFYVLKLYINGEPKHIVVDDLIPCNKLSKSPLFTKPIGNEVWVLLLEKAWAKVIGNYLSAEAMTPDHMMQDLSGAPGYGSWFKTEGQLTRQKKLEECMRHDSLGHIIVITSVGDKKIEGIANNHAYSLLKTFNYQGKKLFKIRNPWGRFEWNGQYGQNSALWTPELKKITGFEKKDDGIFFLSEPQVFEAFCYYSVSQIHPDFKYSFYPFQSGASENLFFKATISSDSEVNFRITQPFKRMVKDSSYDHSPMAFETGKIEADGSVTYLQEGHSRTYWGAKSVHAFTDITKNLKKGQYFIRVKMLWKNPSKFNKAVLAGYANNQIKFDRLESGEGENLWKKMLVSVCKDHPERKTNGIIYKVVTMKGQFVFPVMSDTEKTVTFKFDRAKMNLVDMGMGQINDHELQMKVSAGNPDVGTMERLEPAKGGSTGQFFITVQ